MSNIRYAMVIDQRRCIGCHTCAIACKSENYMPNGANMNLNRVITEGSGVTDLPVGIPIDNFCSLDDYNRAEGTVRLDYLTMACQHCTDAPCVPACPTGATKQREDGVVVQDVDLCVGCSKCVQACPYEMGAMRVYLDNPAFSVDFRSGSQEASPSRPGTVKKCTFCSHRLDAGEEPFCIAHCPGRARFFGNINDPQSDVYKLTHGARKVKQPFAIRGNMRKPESAVYFIE